MNNLIKKELIGLEKVSFNDSLSKYEQKYESYEQVIDKVDLIDRQAAIDVLETDAELLRRVLDDTDVVGNAREKFAWGLELIELFIDDMKKLSSTEPKTKLIVEVKMSKEDIQDMVDEAVEKIKAEIEVPEIIRCRDCKYASPNGVYGCRLERFLVHDENTELFANDYCSAAERRTDEQTD